MAAGGAEGEARLLAKPRGSREAELAAQRCKHPEPFFCFKRLVIMENDASPSIGPSKKPASNSDASKLRLRPSPKIVSDRSKLCTGSNKLVSRPVTWGPAEHDLYWVIKGVVRMSDRQTSAVLASVVPRHVYHAE